MVAGARALIDSLDTLSVFEAAVVDDRTREWAERRVGGLELCMDNPDMDISWGTPYGYPRQVEYTYPAYIAESNPGPYWRECAIPLDQNVHVCRIFGGSPNSKYSGSLLAT